MECGGSVYEEVTIPSRLVIRKVCFRFATAFGVRCLGIALARTPDAWLYASGAEKRRQVVALLKRFARKQERHID